MLRAILAAAALVASPALAADQAPRPVTSYKAPRAGDGRASLEGVWTNSSMTRLERNPRFSKDLVLTEADVARIEGRNRKLIELGDKPTDPNAKVTDLPADCSGGRGVDCNYNAAWTDPGSTVMRVAGQPRSGYITSTPDGRVPMRKDIQVSPFGRRLPPGVEINDNPESRSPGERCLLSFGNSSGPVMIPGLYNNTYQFVQTADHVAIVVEMVHDARIVRLNARHRTDGVRPWLGDSIGWWDGDTLVVETTNFPKIQAYMGSWERLKVTERFRRVAKDRLHYQFKVEDPSIWVEPWGGEYEFAALQGLVYEYACHEGNYAMPGILAGSRAADRADAEVRSPGASEPR